GGGGGLVGVPPPCTLPVSGFDLLRVDADGTLLWHRREEIRGGTIHLDDTGVAWWVHRQPAGQQSYEVALQKIDSLGRMPAATVLPDVGVCLTHSLRGPVQGNLLLRSGTSHTLISTDGAMIAEYPNPGEVPYLSSYRTKLESPEGFLVH